jgi:hypothetical protein
VLQGRPEEQGLYPLHQQEDIQPAQKVHQKALHDWSRQGVHDAFELRAI